MRSLKYLVLLVVWYPLREVIRLCTTKRGAYRPLLWIGNLLGTLYYLLSGRGRRIATDVFARLGLLLPGVVRKTFQALARREVEGMVQEDLNRELIERITVFEGLEHLDAALAKGRGAIMVLFHFGWHMHLFSALGFLGYPIHQVFFPRDEARGGMHPLERLLRERQRRNARNLPVTFHKAGGLLRDIYTLLAANEVLMVTIDGRAAKSFDAFPFLAGQIHLSPTIFKILPRTGSPVLPLFTYLGEDGRHRVIAHPAVTATEPTAILAEIVTLFEGYVRERPEQYGAYLLLCEAARAAGDGSAPLVTF